jgi:hypothetical protein
MAGQWVCCGGVFSTDQRCISCGCSQVEDASACALFEAGDPVRIAAGRYPGDVEMIAFKWAHGYGSSAAVAEALAEFERTDDRAQFARGVLLSVVRVNPKKKNRGGRRG